jgi:TRAP-type uncharacterized transport system substrate-binding protein
MVFWLCKRINFNLFYGEYALKIKNSPLFGKSTLVYALTMATMLASTTTMAVSFSTKSPSSKSGSASSYKSAPKSNLFKTGGSTVSPKFGKTYNSNIEKQYNKQASKKSFTAFKSWFPSKKPAHFPEADIKSYRNRYGNNGTFRQAGRDNNNWESRDRYYQSHPPIVVNGGGNSFGMLSGMFLYSLLNNSASAGEYAYHHQHDEDYLKWRAEADRLAKNNAELKAQLDKTDSVKQSKGNVQPNPDWLPDGIPAAAVLSDQALKSSQPDFNVCVGSEAGPYYKIAQSVLLPELIEWVNINPIVTKGTPEILAKIAAGDCDAGFAQGDADFDKDKLETIFRPFYEAAHLACSIKVKGKAIDDLAGLSVWIPKNSGSRVTWDRLVSLNGDYGKIIAKESVNYEDAIFKALQTQSCLFYMAAPHAASLDRLIDRKDLKLMSISDGRLLKGDIYQSKTLSSKDYSRTIQGHFFWAGHIDTVVSPVAFVMSNAWKAQHAELAAKISLKLADIENKLKESVNQ